MVLVNMSLPRGSVPNQCAAEGWLLICAKSVRSPLSGKAMPAAMITARAATASPIESSMRGSAREGWESAVDGLLGLRGVSDVRHGYIPPWMRILGSTKR